MTDKAIKTVNLYKNLGWPHVFARIRFFTANFEKLETFLPKKGRILDLGCGYGIFVNYLALTSPKREVVGVELDKQKLKHANQKVSHTSFRYGDATKIKIPPVDVILLIHVLHHLNSYEEQEKLIHDCYKLLPKNKLLLVAEIDEKPFWKYLITQLADYILYPGDRIYYRKRNQFKKLFEENGFRVEDITFHQNTPFSHVLFKCQKRKRSE